MNTHSVGNMNLLEIVKRRKLFIENNTIYNKDDFQLMTEGELRAYNEMIIDIQQLDEKDFQEKYLRIVKDIGKAFENEEITDKDEIERLSGYNNEIVYVLRLLDPINKYDLD